MINSNNYLGGHFLQLALVAFVAGARVALDRFAQDGQRGEEEGGGHGGHFAQQLQQRRPALAQLGAVHLLQVGVQEVQQTDL